MLAVVDDDYRRAEHSMLEPAYGANLFIFWWLFSLVQVCGQRVAKYFRTIKFRSWTFSFSHLLPLSFQKNVEELHNGINGPHSNQETPTVIIEDTQPMADSNCNCVVCTTNSDEEFSISHSYSSSCTTCTSTSSSSSSSLSFSEEEQEEEEEEEEEMKEKEYAIENCKEEENIIEKAKIENKKENKEEIKEDSKKMADVITAAAVNREAEKMEVKTNVVETIGQTVKLKGIREQVDEAKEIKIARNKDREVVREEVKMEDEVKYGHEEGEENEKRTIIPKEEEEEEEEEKEETLPKVRETVKIEIKEEQSRKAREKAGVKNEETMKEETRTEVKEGMKKQEQEVIKDESKKEDEVSIIQKAPKVQRLSAYSQFTKIPPAPPNSPMTKRRRSKVKELATWFEEKVIVRPDQIPEKKPDLTPEQPLKCPKTYDSNNNKRVVGELISFFCSQDPPRPRPQPISEARINVMNLIETFEKKAENSSRHYPFIPLHVEHFV